MIDKVFSITGNKISAFIADENSLKFSSSTADSVDTFRAAFAKTLSLATKVEIKYDAIKSIKKEDNDKDVLIKYKTFAGIPAECEFSFSDPADYATFFTFFEQERYFTSIHETLSPFKAIKNYLIGLSATIGFTAFTWYHAMDIKNGTAEEVNSGKGKAFDYIVGLLGDKGVLAIGILISGYLIYKIRKRFSNPPNQTRLLPPNA
ncbi:hypothetical protein [Ferruginibacter profundus]